jgi:hypothetical protein
MDSIKSQTISQSVNKNQFSWRKRDHPYRPLHGRRCS